MRGLPAEQLACDGARRGDVGDEETGRKLSTTMRDSFDQVRALTTAE